MLEVISKSEDPEEAVPFIEVQYKNVEQLSLNLYEVDLETYFLKNHCPFDPNTSFSGIYPSKSREIKLSNSDPFKIRTLKIEIEEIKKEQKGLFLVELHS